MIPVILKGDTSAKISLSIADGWDYAAVVLEVGFCDTVTTIVEPVAGSVIDVAFTAEQSAHFPLGTHKVTFTLRNADGGRCSLPWGKIKVTDAPGEVYDAAISVDPGAIVVDDATAADSLGDVKAKLNKVLDYLRNNAVTVCVALAVALPVFGAGVQTAALNDIPGDAQVVTNVSGLVTAPAVTNIARAVVEGEISPDNAVFSNAVLSVGIGVDTNAVAALNALLDGEGDALPVGGATTVGGLLVALAAALAALKKKVMEKYPFVAAAITGDTLTLTPYSRNALTSDGTAFTVLMGGVAGKLRDCVFVVTAGATAPNISWGEVGGQTFNPRTDEATDMEIAANTTKVFWVTEYAEDKFAVAGWEVPSVSE